MKVLKAIILLPRDMLECLIRFFPGSIGNAMRRVYWRMRLGKLGKNVLISEGVYFDSPGHIYIHDYAWIDRNAIFIAGADKSNRRREKKTNEYYLKKEGEIHIGKHVHIAPFTLLNGHCRN